MTEKTFSIKEALAFGWNSTKGNLGFFIGVMLIVWVAAFIPGLINNWVQSTVLAVIVAIVFRLVQWFLEIGLVRIGLAFADGRPTAVPALWTGTAGPLYLRYVAGSILYGLIVLAGTLLLIVPGIILSIGLFYYSYLIVDKDAGPVDALKQSWALTKGVRWRLFLFGLAALGINVLGLLALVVGLFITVPTTFVALAYVYRQLQHQSAAA
jgi:hypothetical protein